MRLVRSIDVDSGAAKLASGHRRAPRHRAGRRVPARPTRGARPGRLPIRADLATCDHPADGPGPPQVPRSQRMSWARLVRRAQLARRPRQAHPRCPAPRAPRAPAPARRSPRRGSPDRRGCGSGRRGRRRGGAAPRSEPRRHPRPPPNRPGPLDPPHRGGRLHDPCLPLAPRVPRPRQRCRPPGSRPPAPVSAPRPNPIGGLRQLPQACDSARRIERVSRPAVTEPPRPRHRSPVAVPAPSSGRQTSGRGG